jgi:hypothetical protein
MRSRRYVSTIAVASLLLGSACLWLAIFVRRHRGPENEKRQQMSSEARYVAEHEMPFPALLAFPDRQSPDFEAQIRRQIPYVTEELKLLKSIVAREKNDLLAYVAGVERFTWVDLSAEKKLDNPDSLTRALETISKNDFGVETADAHSSAMKALFHLREYCRFQDEVRSYTRRLTKLQKALGIVGDGPTIR